MDANDAFRDLFDQLEQDRAATPRVHEHPAIQMQKQADGRFNWWCDCGIFHHGIATDDLAMKSMIRHCRVVHP